jgi:hypothetical protein
VGVLKLVLGLGLVGVVLWLLGPQWSQVLDMAQLHPVPLGLGLLATTCASIVTSGRWKLLAESMGGTRLPYLSYFHAFTLTRVLGQFTSNLAMDTVGRGVALRSAGSERGLGHSLTPIVLERIFDLVLPIVVGVWALATVELSVDIDPALALGLAALAFLALAVPLLAPLARLAIAVYSFLARRREGFSPTPVEVSRATAAKVAALSLARFFFVVLQFWAVAVAFGIDVDWASMAAATPLAQITSLMGFTPGSWGFQEIGWALGLGWVKLGPEAIALFVLAQRVAVTSYFGALSLLSWPFARRASDLRERSGSATPSA